MKLYTWGDLYKIYTERLGFGGFNWNDHNTIELVNARFEVEQHSAPIENVVVEDEKNGSTMVAAQRGPEAVFEGSITSRAIPTMSDEEWTMSTVTRRWNQVAQFNWLTSHAQDTVLYVTTVPDGIFPSTLSQIPWENFTYFRGDILLRIEMSGNRFQAGQLAAVYVPFIPKSQAASWHLGGNRPALTFLDTVEMMQPRTSGSATIKVPFIAHKNYIMSFTHSNWNVEIDRLGTFALYVFNVLRDDGVSTQGTQVTVYASIENAQFHVPQGNALGRDFEHIEMHGNTVNSKVTNVFERAGNVTMPIETNADKIDAKGQISGLDKVNVGIQPQYMVRKPLGYTSHCENVEMLQRLSLKASGLSLTEPFHFGSSEDVMNIRRLCSRPTLLTTLQWSASQATQTLLYENAVTPCHQIWNKASNVSIIGNTFYPTMLEAIACKFNMWRGDLELTVEVVCTSMHRGRLMLVFSPGFSTLGGSVSYLGAQNLYKYNIELTDCCARWKFKFPFRTDYPWLRIPNGNANYPGSGNSWKMEYIVGEFAIYVVNPLSGPEVVSQTVDVNLYVSMPNIQLWGLGINNVSIVDLVAQGGKVEMHADVGSMTQECITICNGIDNVGEETLQFGERIDSLREVAKRYAQVYTNNNPYNVFGNISYDFTGLPETTSQVGFVAPHTLDTNLFVQYGPFAYFARMFGAWRGSTRWKFLRVHQETNSATTPFFLNNRRWLVHFNADVFNPASVSTQYYFITKMLSLTAGYNDSNTHSHYAMLASPTSVVDTSMGTLAASDFCDNNNMYHEVEAPFGTMFNILKVPQGDSFTTPSPYVTTGAGYNLKSYSGGTLFVGVVEEMQNDVSDRTLIAWACAGDEFRLGIPLGPHKCFVNGFRDTNTSTNQPIGGDNY